MQGANCLSFVVCFHLVMVVLSGAWKKYPYVFDDYPSVHDRVCALSSIYATLHHQQSSYLPCPSHIMVLRFIENKKKHFSPPHTYTIYPRHTKKAKSDCAAVTCSVVA